MQPAIIFGSLILLIAALFVLHRLRLGGSTEYFTGYISLLWFIIFFASAVNIVWAPEMFPTFKLRMSTAVYALCFSAILLVYILEGLDRARRLILLSILLQILLIGVQLLVHVWLQDSKGSNLFQFKIWRTSVSIVLTVINLVMAVILFQFLVNRIPKIPLALALTLALLFTLTFDSVAYVGLTRSATFMKSLIPQLILKTSITFSLFPFIATYLYFHRDHISSDLSRGSFDVFGRIDDLQQDLALANEQLKEHAANLEVKVEERTKELQKTLSDVQKLKKQQDGDYFLTSLLIQPLAVNKVDSNKITIECFTSQKKKFTFNKWTTEIGGDISIAHQFPLRNRGYTLVVNADAMGKSIQGAGGALVLGVVLNSLVTRTKKLSGFQKLYPEQWLRACFLELQSTFVTFDGSMLISMALGLIDESSGVYYYFNCEHPFSVLYRDNKASFLPNELSTHKVGVEEAESQFAIATMQLYTGDMIFMGSDGRDDILTGKSEDGQRVINEDENLFLAYVTQSKGDIEALSNAIIDSGDLIDDLSLVKIAWQGEVLDQDAISTELEKIPSMIQDKNYSEVFSILMLAAESIFNSDLFKKGITTLLKAKKYEESFQACEKISLLHPSHSEFLFLASYAAKLNRDYEAAIDYGERFRLREPKNLRSLVQLADSYRLVGNNEKATEMANQAEQHGSVSKELKKLKTILASNN